MRCHGHLLISGQNVAAMKSQHYVSNGDPLWPPKPHLFTCSAPSLQSVLVGRHFHASLGRRLWLVHVASTWSRKYKEGLVDFTLTRDWLTLGKIWFFKSTDRKSSIKEPFQVPQLFLRQFLVYNHISFGALCKCRQCCCAMTAAGLCISSHPQLRRFSLLLSGKTTNILISWLYTDSLRGTNTSSCYFTWFSPVHRHFKGLNNDITAGISVLLLLTKHQRKAVISFFFFVGLQSKWTPVCLSFETPAWNQIVGTVFSYSVCGWGRRSAAHLDNAASGLREKASRQEEQGSKGLSKSVKMCFDQTGLGCCGKRDMVTARERRVCPRWFCEPPSPVVDCHDALMLQH